MPKHTRNRPSRHGRAASREDGVSYLEGIGFDMMSNGEAMARLGWDNDDPDDIAVGTLDRGDGLHATIGEEYDSDGKPTGCWSGAIEYEPSGSGNGSYAISGRGGSSEEAIADMEGALIRAISINGDGKHVTNETFNASRSETGFEVI